MLVYANVIETRPTADGVRLVLDAVGGWLARKTYNFILAEQLQDGYSRRLKDGKEVAVHIAGGGQDGYPILASVVFGHPDDRVPGRKWFLRIGVRQENPESSSTVTVVAETSDISVQVGRAPVFATRPGVVCDIVGKCGVKEGFPSPEPLVLDGDGGDAFLDKLEDPSRSYAIVLVSPDPYSEKPLINPNVAASLTIGLAEVHTFANKSATFNIAQAVGRNRSAWGGAVNIVFPCRGPYQYAANQLLRPDEVRDHHFDGHSVRTTSCTASRTDSTSPRHSSKSRQSTSIGARWTYV